MMDELEKELEFEPKFIFYKTDTLVPFHMGKKIYDAANEPKYYYFPGL